MSDRQVFDDIGNLAAVLRPPSDLIAFYRVVEQFHPVWHLYLEIADPAQKSALDSITETLQAISDRRLPLEERYPKCGIKPPNAVTGMRSTHKRNTLTGYYATHPWYAVFWHECALEATEPQYRALVASLLPAFVQLEDQKHKLPQLIWGATSLGLSLRQLTDPQAAEEKAFLANLPLTAMPPADLLALFRSHFDARGLKTAAQMGKRFSHIIRVLEWWNSDSWPTRDLFRKIAHPSGRASPQHGATAKADVEIGSSRLHDIEAGIPLSATTWHKPGSPDGSEDTVGADHDPDMDGAETSATTKVPIGTATSRHRSDRARAAAHSARYAAQAIEMAGQQLPVSRITLTGHDLRVLLETLDDLGDSVWSALAIQDRETTAAWLASLFYLSREAGEVSELRKGGTRRASLHICADPSEGYCWLPVQSPRHNPPEKTEAASFIEPLDTPLKIPMPQRLRRALLAAPTHRGRYFPEGQPKGASALLNELNRRRGTQLTIGRVANFLSASIRQLGSVDHVYAIYFTGAHPNQHKPAVYSAVPVKRLEDLYSQACAHAESLAGLRSDARSPELPTLLDDMQPMVGSRHVPRSSSVKSILARLYQKVDRLRLKPGPVQLAHNRYTALTAFILLAITGIRATRNGPTLVFDIDRRTSTAFVSEKDNDGYTNARLVFLHPIVLQQLDAYIRHETRLRQFLGLLDPRMVQGIDDRITIQLLSTHRKPDRSNDLRIASEYVPTLFFLDHHGRSMLPLDRAQIALHLDEPSWIQHLGALRHFVRTNLLLRTCSGELINAQFGHCDRGQHPWGPFSTLPPAAWRAEMARHLGGLAQEIGLRAIDSPLFESAYG